MKVEMLIQNKYISILLKGKSSITYLMLFRI